jgi:hypothetical protein
LQRRHDGEDSQMRFARLFRIQRGDGRRVALVVGVTLAATALTIGESGNHPG